MRTTPRWSRASAWSSTARSSIIHSACTSCSRRSISWRTWSFAASFSLASSWIRYRARLSCALRSNGRNSNRVRSIRWQLRTTARQPKPRCKLWAPSTSHCSKCQSIWAEWMSLSLSWLTTIQLSGNLSRPCTRWPCTRPLSRLWGTRCGRLLMCCRKINNL